VFEALDQVGLLTRLIPEWAAVRCQPQHNAAHRFTVDRHLIETAVEASALTRRVGRPDLLLIGAFLHDIGKGFPGDHTEAGVAVAPTIASRMGLPAEDVATVTDLVRHHLLLPDTATRRDLDDPATIEIVTSSVPDHARLELLHALTVADAAATGPAAWSEWKAGLVAELVRRASHALVGERPPVPDPLTDRQREVAARGELAVDLTDSMLTVVAPDRPGLLWRWAGVAALHRLVINAATAATVPSENGPMAVTVFHIAPRFGSLPDLEPLAADIRHAYEDAAPLEAKLADREQAYANAGTAAPPVVLWFDDESNAATIVEVRAHDKIGLLYRLTRVLAEEGLDVRSARVQTLGAEVVDAFYVVDRAGSTVVDPAVRAGLEAALVAAC
jgi:[protein-PII] uridylyltransferase